MEYRHRRRHHPGRAGPGRRLRGLGGQRLAGRQPVHRDREPEHPPPRRRPVRQRPAPGRHRAEEPHRRGRHRLDRLAAAPDLPGRTPQPVLHERGLDRLRRPGRPHRHPHRRQGVVQTLAHRHRRVPGRYGGAGAAGPPGGHLPPRAFPGPGAGLHRL